LRFENYQNETLTHWTDSCGSKITIPIKTFPTWWGLKIFNILAPQKRSQHPPPTPQNENAFEIQTHPRPQAAQDSKTIAAQWRTNFPPGSAGSVGFQRGNHNPNDQGSEGRKTAGGASNRAQRGEAEDVWKEIEEV
jgi:hypothetical protein